MSGKPDKNKSPWWYNLYRSIKDAPINLSMLLVSAFVFYKVMTITQKRRNEQTNKIQLPELHRNFTIKELREYDGTRDDGRILLAVNRNVYDVSTSSHFYGKDGASPQYAGSDISRDLINLDQKDSEKFDYLSDLNEMQISALVKWDQEYAEKYPLVGVLVPEYGEEQPNYVVDDMM